MKHIGWCLERIQYALAGLPNNIDSEEDKAKASRIIDEVEEYAHTLEQLVYNHKLRVHLNRLSKAPIDGVRLQEHEVVELMKDLKHMLYLLDLYIKELRDLMKSHSGTWRYKLKQTGIAMIHLLDKDKRRLGRDYSIAKNIKTTIGDRCHQFSKKAQYLTQEIDSRFGGEKTELRKEFQIVLYQKQELKDIVSSEKHLAEFLK
ncbi:MAG: hypothetical protein KJ709_03555 [Nanoarchaeota archaeon]|nr:hypothetical protein [Nanoarchaeota archaeon]